MDNKNSRLIIVSYRIPFKVERNEDGSNKLFQSSGGLVSAILAIAEEQKKNFNFEKIVWVGYSENSKDEFNEVMDGYSLFDLQPVHIPEDTNKKFYEGFCNGTIWPLFHYFPSHVNYVDEDFNAYLNANEIFFHKLKEIIVDSDIIWVHDYHLFILPGLIRNSFPNACVGFFLHIPFPSFEIFRLLKSEWRIKILQGLLGSDLIGFHTSSYSQHFLKTIRSILQIETSLNKIFYNNRTIMVDNFPVGIDYEKFSRTASAYKAMNIFDNLGQSLKDKKLIFSVDRLDYTKGLINRIKSFEYFLEKYPQFKSKVIFNLVVVPSRDNIQSYISLKNDLEQNIGRINGKFGNIDWLPIVYQYKSIPFEELTALYNYSHVGLITPIRDGMNLVAKEFIACQVNNIGVLILSEMAGAAEELSEAILINPNDINETADAILSALLMSKEEKIRRNKKLKERIKNYDVFTWSNDFISKLSQSYTENQKKKFKILTAIEIVKIKEQYQEATKRLILFDYDGTLVPFARFPQQAIPTSESINILKELIKDDKNTTAIISGRDKVFLDKCFGDLNLHIIAEHGAMHKRPNSQWINLVEINSNWKREIIPVMENYVKRCSGTFIEKKQTAIVWHYRNADSDFAHIRVEELKEELFEMLAKKTDLQLLEGNKILEVKQTTHNKGESIFNVFNKTDYDFILAIGDDKTDEDMFEALPYFAVSLRVGLSNTSAKFNLEYQSDVFKFIKQIIS